MSKMVMSVGLDSDMVAMISKLNRETLEILAEDMKTALANRLKALSASPQCVA